VVAEELTEQGTFSDASLENVATILFNFLKYRAFE
jgi:hypothetical protein